MLLLSCLLSGGSGVVDTSVQISVNGVLEDDRLYSFSKIGHAISSQDQMFMVFQGTFGL